MARVKIMEGNVRACSWSLFSVDLVNYNTPAKNGNREIVLTPSSSIHSPTSPSLSGLENSEVSPLPSSTNRTSHIVLQAYEEDPTSYQELSDSNIRLE